MENLQVGTLGWLHDSWESSFYPDDMPAEWRLDYYSNMYHVVIVPQSEWVLWDSEVIEEVEESVEEGFQFYFQVLDGLNEETATKFDVLNQHFSECIAGIVLFTECEGEVPTEINGYPVTVISKSKIVSGWQWQSDDYVCSGAPCGIVFNLDKDAKRQTEILKSYVESLPRSQKEAPLFVAGDGIDTMQLANLKTIAEFLGY